MVSERTFPTEDPTCQVKGFGAVTDEDLHIFIHGATLDRVLADAAESPDAQRVGGLIGGRFRAGNRRFIEISASTMLAGIRDPSQPLALEEEEWENLRVQQRRLCPHGELLGLYLTHPRLGLYLSRSEAALHRTSFDREWTCALVTDPVADKFTFYVFRRDPVKSGFYVLTRTGPPPPIVRLAEPAAKPALSPLTREELFRLATEEVFKDGKVDEEENRTLQVLGGLLKLSRETAITIAKRARQKHKAGDLAGGGPLDVEDLYRRAVDLAMADGELEADEAHILAALRMLLKLPDQPLPEGADPLAAPPPPIAALPDPTRTSEIRQDPLSASGSVSYQALRAAVPQIAGPVAPREPLVPQAPVAPPAEPPPPTRPVPTPARRDPTRTSAPPRDLTRSSSRLMMGPPPSTGGTPFQNLLTEHAALAFDRQVHALEALGEHAFSWDLEAGTITLAEQSYKMQALGSTRDDEGRFIWAWAATPPSKPLPEHLLTHAQRLQTYGGTHGIPELTRPVLKLDEISLDELALVASGMANAALYYRLPYPGGALTVLVTDAAFGRSTVPPVERILAVFPRLVEAVAVPARAAFAAYVRAYGLELIETASVAAGVAPGGERVVASFDEHGQLVDIR